MQIAIDIPEEKYELIMRCGKDETNYPTTLALYDAVKSGTVLQKPCEWGRMTFDATTRTSVFEFSDGTIKQVKQAELEHCEDAISREAAIKALQNVVCISAAIKSRMVGEIEDLPPVEPSRQNIPKGKTARCTGCRFLKECCAEMVEK